MSKMPIKIIFELKNTNELESVLNSFEKIRDAHPETTIDAEIRVRTKD
jgi:hypothetical protein